MELYEQITRIMELYGLTFDETLAYFLLIMVGSVSGFSFMLSVFFDLGCCLYRLVKDLFLHVLSKFRRKDSVEP